MKFVVVQDVWRSLKTDFQGLKEELEAHKGEKSQRMALLYSFYKGRAKEPKDEFYSGMHRQCSISWENV